MKVKIFTEGGKTIGLGHISRCSSLYDEAINRNISVEFIVYGDIAEVEFLKGRNIINENWISTEYLRNSISSEDYAIVDSYKAETEIYEIISKTSKKAVFIDDVGRIEYPKGIIVNPSLEAIDIDYSKSINSSVLTGPDYVILRTRFIGAKRESRLNGVKRVLIIMGGTDIRKLTLNLISNICKKRLDIKFDIVVNSKNLGLYNDYNNINIYMNIDAVKMMQLMLTADLAITAAGQTIYELLATNTPFIPIQIIENQENNVRALLKYNSEQIILKYDDDNLMDDILELLSGKNAELCVCEQNIKYKGIIDGYGSKRIIDKLVEDM